MKRLRNLLVVAVAFAVIAGLAGCASVPTERNDALVGTWRSGAGDIILNADGSALLAGNDHKWSSTDTLLTFYGKSVGLFGTPKYVETIKWPYELNGETLTLNGMEYTKTK